MNALGPLVLTLDRGQGEAGAGLAEELGLGAQGGLEAYGGRHHGSGDL